MRMSEYLVCNGPPCADVETEGFILPDADIEPDKISVLMITEAPPNEKNDYFYAGGDPFYLQTILRVFRDAGADVSSMRDILDLGVYITTAIKCAKTQYAVSPETMKNCSNLLEREIALFPNVKVFMLMGDVTIKMMNNIWKNRTGKRVIHAGPTYKIREQEYYFEDKRVFPSYTPAGKNFLIEKSKRKMVTEDVKEALRWLAA